MQTSRILGPMTNCSPILFSNRMPHNNYNSYGWTGYLSFDWITGKCNVPWSRTFMNHVGTAQGSDSGVTIPVYCSNSRIRQKLVTCYMCFIPTVWKVFPWSCRMLRNFLQSFTRSQYFGRPAGTSVRMISPLLCHSLWLLRGHIGWRRETRSCAWWDYAMYATKSVVMTLCPFPSFQGNRHHKRSLWFLHHSSYNGAHHMILHPHGYMITLFV
jgi:hypothetical protein